MHSTTAVCICAMYGELTKLMYAILDHFGVCIGESQFAFVKLTGSEAVGVLCCLTGFELGIFTTL